MKRLLLCLLALCCLTASALAEPTLPVRTDAGFLPAGEEPYIYQNREEGRWVYLGEELFINIFRFEDEEEKIVWFETEIYCAGETRLRSLLTQGTKPGRNFRIPQEIADPEGVVLAFNDDYFGNRWYNDKKQGIIIRNGVVFSDETMKNNAHAFPALEVLALFGDGSLKTFLSQEYTAEEYLEMGVTDTYAFGPILVQNGQLGERMLDEEYSPYREPRCALGMIEPNHYILLTAVGRTSDSKGVRLRWLADRMLNLGAVEALNLDGGRTTYLYFMGELLNYSEKVRRKDLRTVTSMIGIGTTPGFVPEAAEE